MPATATAKVKTAAVLQKEWVPLEEAVRMLDKSERSIQRLFAAGYLRRKSDESTGEFLYHAGDLLTIREKGIRTSRQDGASGVKRDATPATPNGAGRLPIDALTSVLRELIASNLRPPQIAASNEAAKPEVDVPITLKLWLKMREAQALSGLRRSQLLDLIEAGKLQAFYDKYEGWKVRRVSLEAAVYEGGKSRC